MQSKNIFIGSGLKPMFAGIIYDALMKRKEVSTADILSIYYQREPGYYDKMSYSSETGYGEFKKAYSDVIKALKDKIKGCIIDNGKTGKGKTYKYIGEEADPLAEERQAVALKSVEDYVSFCKASAGILPSTWFSSFFENTQLLLDTKHEAQSGAGYISSCLEQNLTNIELLPELYKAISNRQVLRFYYQPFGKDAFEITLHPQFLKEYNGRWFVFGEANREPYHAYNVPLDRIQGELHVATDIDYIPAPHGFYQGFFNNIIGVTHERDAKVETVVIRTKTAYQHGLILTKPLHHSQQETLPFAEHPDGSYGEVTMQIEPNRELCGKILAYGQYLEVMQPQSLREKISEIVNSICQAYTT